MPSSGFDYRSGSKNLGRELRLKDKVWRYAHRHLRWDLHEFCPQHIRRSYSAPHQWRKYRKCSSQFQTNPAGPSRLLIFCQRGGGTDEVPPEPGCPFGNLAAAIVSPSMDQGARWTEIQKESSCCHQLIPYIITNSFKIGLHIWVQ